MTMEPDFDGVAVVSKINKAMGDIAYERMRQIGLEGYTPEHDDEHDNGEIALAAATYALLAGAELGDEENMDLDAAIMHVTKWVWPWSPKALKPTDARRMLIKSAALIVAEVERIDRAAQASGSEVKENENGA